MWDFICIFATAIELTAIAKLKIALALNLSFDILKRELSAMSSRVKYVGPSKGGHWEIITTDRWAEKQ